MYYHYCNFKRADDNNKDTIFYKVNINTVIDSNKNSNFKSKGINIAIGSISINIPVSGAKRIYCLAHIRCKFFEIISNPDKETLKNLEL